MRRTAWRVVVLAGVLVVFTRSSAGTVAPFTCGMVATTDVDLMADLTCAGTALTVGADAIEIDLRGHTLTIAGGDAVFNGGHHHVTVRYGSIRGGAVVVTDGAGWNTVASLRLTDADIRLERSDQAFVYRNTLSSGDIIADTSSARHLVMSNTLDHGSIILDGRDITLRDNTLESGDIVNIEGSHIAVIGNRVKLGGIRMQNAESGDVVVMDNKVTASPSDGIRVFCLRSTAGAPARIVRNEVTWSAGSGIHLFDADGSNAVLANNYASHNGVCGIDAPGAVDGGLNRAKDNAGAVQCIGVACP